MEHLRQILYDEDFPISVRRFLMFMRSSHTHKRNRPGLDVFCDER